MSNYTTFKVIKIINEYSLVINGGVDHDVSLDDDIEIFIVGDIITDPFNDDKELGTLDFIKERLIVTEVYREFSVCEKISKEEVYQPSTMERIIRPLGTPSETVIKKHKVKMQIDPSEATDRKTTDEPVKIGDHARIALSS